MTYRLCRHVSSTGELLINKKCSLILACMRSDLSSELNLSEFALCSFSRICWFSERAAQSSEH